MAHPIVETKWQLDKIRALVNQIDTELDEADYRINQSEELREQEDKREIDRKALASLAQNAISVLYIVNSDDGQEVNSSVANATELLKQIIKELEK